MNMQAMIQQAQKIQRDLKRAIDEIKAKDFVVSKNGIVTLTMKGSKEIVSIDIDADALEPDNKEMVEEAIMLAYQDLVDKIDEEIGDANERVTGRREGLM